MKKLFKDNNKTAMQFVPTIVSHINDGSTQIETRDKCSETLFNKIHRHHAAELQGLIYSLVEDATGKTVVVGLGAEKINPDEYVVSTYTRVYL